MNLISCNSCGTVLGANKLIFPNDIYLEDGGVNLDKAGWDGEGLSPKIKCPVCKNDIIKDKMWGL